MTPKEFDFMLQVLEKIALEAYKTGYEHAKQGKHPAENSYFAISSASRMVIKTNLEKATKSR